MNNKQESTDNMATHEVEEEEEEEEKEECAQTTEDDHPKPSSKPNLSPRENNNIVEEIIHIIDSIKVIGEYRKTQRKDCLNLVRRLYLFLPLLEEIRDVNGTIIPHSGLFCLKKMKKAFRSAVKLLKMCHAGSKIYLALESEAMMVRFRNIYDKVSQGVEGMPFEELGISEEEREQIEMLRAQLRRAKKRADTQDMELAMDLMVALSADDRNGDCASIERLANKLSLHTADELKQEALAVKKLVKERRGLNPDSTQQIVNLLNKFERLAAVPQSGRDSDDVQVPKHLSNRIPNEFLCPITLEIMTDPVIISTGQTYERESIQRWLDSNQKTCPKTGQVLTHSSLAPNFALKNLIIQWCEKNNFQLSPKKETPSTSADSNSEDERIMSLVKKLSSSILDEQRGAVKKIRMLSKESPENRTLIANNGGIPSLVQLLSYPDSKIQENAVTALLNLSIDESNKKIISSQEDAIPSIIEILEKGSHGAKENSAAALFSLSMLNENKAKIGSLKGIPPLVELLKYGTIRGKKDAMTALFNLCLNNPNKGRAVEAGIVQPLLKILEDDKLEMVNETLSMLLILAMCPEGRHELGELDFIESLVSLIREGTPKNKECATAVLFELGSNNHNLILAALQYGVYEHLVDLCKNGTERGQRKANSMLMLMRSCEQI